MHHCKNQGSLNNDTNVVRQNSFKRGITKQQHIIKLTTAILSRVIVLSLLTTTMVKAEDSVTPNPETPGGWMWYVDPEKDAEEQPEPEIKPSQKQESLDQKAAAPQTATQQLEIYKQRFEEAKARAILNPTLENISQAQSLHQHMIEQATAFQQMWNFAEMLDVSTKTIPVSPSGVKLEKKEESMQFAADMKALSSSYGLIFAFQKDCPYCHQFAPLVTQFATTHGFDLQGLSKDTSCFEGMSCSQNAAALEALNPGGQYPILYLANPTTKDVIPIARGLVSLSQLEQNLKHAVQYLKNNSQGGQP